MAIPIPLGSLGSPAVVPLLAEPDDALGGWSPTMVEVDDERLNVFASGARCVSLSSAYCVSMVKVPAEGVRTFGELPRHGCGRSDSREMQSGDGGDAQRRRKRRTVEGRCSGNVR